jgi:hypothetical protein
VSLVEMIGSINWLAVVIAWVVTVVIGIVWYRPRVFGTAWAGSVSRWTGTSTRDLLQPSDSTRKLGYWAIAFGVNVIAMALLLAALGASTIGDAIQVALLTTVGFGMSLLSWPVIFARMPMAVLLINSAAFLTMQLANAAILVSIL